MGPLPLWQVQAQQEQGKLVLFPHVHRLGVYESAMGRILLPLCLFLCSNLLIASVSDAIRVSVGLQNNNSTGTDEDTKHHKRNNRVLIGLLSQPSDPAGRHESYIAASYVKFLESAGARVVPFVHDMDKAEIRRR